MVNSFGQQTGHVSVNDMRREITKLLDIIEVDKIENDRDRQFVEDIRRNLGIKLWKPSGKQIFRLREIKDAQL